MTCKAAAGPPIPDQAEFENMLMERHGPDLHQLFKKGRVAVAGLGGLGSHIALALARSGVGHLKLIDFDRVNLSNIGRQAYNLEHLGRLKTEALEKIIKAVNPYLSIETSSLRLTESNMAEELASWSLIIEAFDDPGTKATLVEMVLSRLPEARIICGSGLAGLDRADLIGSRKISSRFFLCGDGKSEAENGCGLMAPRVMVCAGHQANLALRLLANLE